MQNHGCIARLRKLTTPYCILASMIRNPCHQKLGHTSQMYGVLNKGMSIKHAETWYNQTYL